MTDHISNNKASELEVSYKQRMVAYIDILGIKELVKRNDSLKKISKIVNFVRDTALEQKHNPFNLSVSFISDTIVISVDAPSSADDRRIWEILRLAGGISLSLLAIDVACRGSIVVGQIFHYRDWELNFDAVIGPALVMAHELEKSVAIYPRIVVDSSVYNFWEEYISATEFIEQAQDSWRGVLKRDQDGEWFINIFDQHIESTAKFLFPNPEKDILMKAGESINKGLIETDRRVRDKYTWLLSQYLPYASTDFESSLCID